MISATIGSRPGGRWSIAVSRCGFISTARAVLGSRETTLPFAFRRFASYSVPGNLRLFRPGMPAGACRVVVAHGLRARSGPLSSMSVAAVSQPVKGDIRIADAIELSLRCPLRTPFLVQRSRSGAAAFMITTGELKFMHLEELEEGRFAFPTTGNAHRSSPIAKLLRARPATPLLRT